MAFLEVECLRKEYPAGEHPIAVLKDINLSIEAGEMVAIVGSSGSGKSTLMNILGCLDQPTSGKYCISGQDVGNLEHGELARLRREHFGFIFQRYHLLPSMSALENVEMPAIYAGMDQVARRERAVKILYRLGLEDRLHHRPGQLSGGQQQRVSISRALINGGRVVLADEPTGALDTASGRKTMELLTELNAEGHTVIVVTHDMEVAAYARRIIAIRDGQIISDKVKELGSLSPPKEDIAPQPKYSVSAWLDQARELLCMALTSMAAQKLRTVLTMLGIIIGIASVVSAVALGQGSKEKVLSGISAMGTNVIDVFPGEDFGDRRADRIHTLVPDDADAISQQPYVDSATPRISTNVELRYRNVDVSASVEGVGEQYFRVYGYEMAEGQTFDSDMIRHIKQVAVIDQNTREQLFGKTGKALGKVIMLGSVPCKVIGVTKEQQTAFRSSESLEIWVPFTTAMHRIIGQSYLRSITVRIIDGAPMQAAEQGISKLLARRHNAEDFFVKNTDTIRQTIESTTQTMTLLISTIAVISLVVGGIGVMNIMLVSVTERTGEIGVRMAVGARQSDIMSQFLIEAVLVCLFGGGMGIVIALGLGVIMSQIDNNFSMVYSTTSMLTAFVCSTFIGVIFGYLPARNAARLNPVDALAHE